MNIRIENDVDFGKGLLIIMTLFMIFTLVFVGMNHTLAASEQNIDNLDIIRKAGKVIVAKVPSGENGIIKKQGRKITPTIDTAQKVPTSH